MITTNDEMNELLPHATVQQNYFPQPRPLFFYKRKQNSASTMPTVFVTMQIRGRLITLVAREASRSITLR